MTAAQAVLKQLVIVQLADVEDDKEHCVTGSGESAPKLDAVQWLRVISLGSSALKKLLQRVYDVHSVIKATADATAALGNGISENCPDAERFLCQDDHKRVEKKLQVNVLPCSNFDPCFQSCNHKNCILMILTGVAGFCL